MQYVASIYLFECAEQTSVRSVARVLLRKLPRLCPIESINLECVSVESGPQADVAAVAFCVNKALTCNHSLNKAATRNMIARTTCAGPDLRPWLELEAETD